MCFNDATFDIILTLKRSQVREISRLFIPLILIQTRAQQQGSTGSRPFHTTPLSHVYFTPKDIHPFIYSFIHTYIHPLIHSFTHPFIYLSIYLLICSFIHLSIRSLLSLSL